MVFLHKGQRVMSGSVGLFAVPVALLTVRTTFTNPYGTVGND